MNTPSLTKKKPLTEEQQADADRLHRHWDAWHERRRMEGRPLITQAEFGRLYGLGTQGNVWQYLNKKSPLNLKAAAAFAKGLGIAVEGFSPTLAAQAQGLTEPAPAVHFSRRQEVLEPENPEVSFEEALPPHLRKFIEPTIRINDTPVRPDYLSPTLAVEIVKVRGRIADANTSQAVLQLLMIKRERPTVNLHIIVVSQEAHAIKAVVKAACAMYDITISYAESAAEAASLVVFYEGDYEILDPEDERRAP